MSVKTVQRCHRLCRLKEWGQLLVRWRQGVLDLMPAAVKLLLQKPQVMLQLPKLLPNIARQKTQILGQNRNIVGLVSASQKEKKMNCDGDFTLTIGKNSYITKNAQYSHLKS